MTSATWHRVPAFRSRLWLVQCFPISVPFCSPFQRLSAFQGIAVSLVGERSVVVALGLINGVLNVARVPSFSMQRYLRDSRLNSLAQCL